MTELKLCPFCGGPAHMSSDYSSEHGKTRWNLWHECEGHEGGSAGYGYALHPWFETPWYDTEAEAVEAWNTRAERTCRMEYQTGKDNPKRGWWLCNQCGCLTDSVAGGWDGRRHRMHPPAYCACCGAKVVEL